MQINIPDDPKFHATAAARGFANVQEYVVAFLEGVSDAQTTVDDSNGSLLPRDQWKLEFDDLLASLQPGNPNYDDRRQSIYPVRD